MGTEEVCGCMGTEEVCGQEIRVYDGMPGDGGLDGIIGIIGDGGLKTTK